MKCLLSGSITLYKNPQGQYFAPAIYNDAFFERYLAVFESLRIIAKVIDASEAQVQGMSHIANPKVEVYPIYYYKGLKQLAFKLVPVLRSFKAAGQGCEVAIYRVAQIESFIAYAMRPKHLVYGVEVVNDPASWANHKLVTTIASKMLSRMAKKADGAAYVTQTYLQSRYPTNPNAIQAAYSSVSLAEEAISTPRHYGMQASWRLIHISNVIESYDKGHQTVLEVVAKLKERGILVDVTFVGQGHMIETFQANATSLNIANQVHFIGKLANQQAVFEALESHDIMLFPSFSEGLPRVLIEACAKGLPALSTPICGIPELLDETCLFDPKDVEGFANRLEEWIEAPRLLNEQSARNVETAKRYTNSVLQAKRRAYYEALAQKAKERAHD